MDLDHRDKAIIAQVPQNQSILTVGCGKMRLETGLKALGHKVWATDVNEPYDAFLDIREPKGVPPHDVVICSQVLEHIKDLKVAINNLRELALNRLIITVPYGASFYDPGHYHIFYDSFTRTIFPHADIVKIITKEKDLWTRQRNYLIIE